MTLHEIAAFLANEIMTRESEARRLYVELRYSNDVDNTKKVATLLTEAKLLGKAYQTLAK